MSVFMAISVSVVKAIPDFLSDVVVADDLHINHHCLCSISLERRPTRVSSSFLFIS